MSEQNENAIEKYFKQIFFQFNKPDDHSIFLQKVDDFCDKLRIFNIEGLDPSMETSISDYLINLKVIMKSIKPPYTVILENHYVDKSFRDSYYRYFSSRHFNVNRTSKRLSFFQGLISVEEYIDHNIPCVRYEEAQKYKDRRQLVYLGSIVINPIMTGAIGRTLLDPRCLNLQKPEMLPIYMRLSHFKMHIYGRTLKVKAFPYRMQDKETTKCAEITFLNLMDYYSNHYPDYKSTLPGEILDMEKRHSNERVLPSRGMNYAVMSKLMYYFGFSPRLYDYRSIVSSSGSKVTPEITLKRWMYYYAESGIPIAVELRSSSPTKTGHSVICIGHGAMDKTKIREAHTLGRKDGCRKYLYSADFYDSFVIIDDNTPVYNIREYKQLSHHPELKLASLAVPLNRRMCLDAPDAESVFLAILNDEKIGLDSDWRKTHCLGEEDCLGENDAVILRIFLASSHSLKKHRVETLKNKDFKEYYLSIPMPRFVWVCELYRVNDYLKPQGDVIKAFGEIVLDTTSVPTDENPSKSIIFIHYPGKFTTRFPENNDNWGEIDNDNTFPGFSNTLTKII